MLGILIYFVSLRHKSKTIINLKHIPMKKNKMLLTGLIGLLSLGMVHAQEFVLHPTPQMYNVQAEDSIAIPENYRLQAFTHSEGQSALELLQTILPGKTSSAPFTIIIGTKGDKNIKKYARNIPKQAEGYYLKISKGEIVIAGTDERGTYYGVQTLSQLLTLPKLPQVEITDYPDVPFRGVVEGFYGTPWSHEARLRQLEFYGRNKMNVYLYGPKNDPYHSTPNWRKPYPEKEGIQLQELVKKAQANNVIFYWAIHPGQDIQWNEADRQNLLNKFESMYQLGVRGFAVFFDDISGEGTKADKQAELLNFLDEQFVKVKGDVAPLIMCPTEYNKSWSNVEGGYLTTLGEQLNQGIQIMWTGDRVVATIDKQTLDFINPLIKRKAYIWWNFPVSDYVRDHLLMGAVYGNGLDIKNDMEGFVSNPMEHAEASKISLYSIADYAWNMDEYNSEQSWKQAIKDLMPQHAKWLEIFATHNSDLGNNGHRFHREESQAIQPAASALVEAYQQQKSIPADAFQKMDEECNQVVIAADMLMASNENRPLIDDIKPWLIQFKLLGEYGQEVLRMMQLQQAGQQEAFKTAHAHAKAIQALMHETDATYNQNPYQPGVECGSKVLLPTFNTLFETTTRYYNEANGTSLDEQASYVPYTLHSNVAQLASLPVQPKGNTGNVSPSNEVINWPVNGEITISMDYARHIGSVEIDLGTQGAESLFKLESSTDGTNWQPATLAPAKGKTLLKATDINGKVLKLRLINTSGKEQQVYLKRFRFQENR